MGINPHTRIMFGSSLKKIPLPPFLEKQFADFGEIDKRINPFDI